MVSSSYLAHSELYSHLLLSRQTDLNQSVAQTDTVQRETQHRGRQSMCHHGKHSTKWKDTPGTANRVYFVKHKLAH